MTDGLRIVFTLVVMAVGFRFKAGLGASSPGGVVGVALGWASCSIR
jgi:hypothetical protein